jgi:hypothetical protein
MSDVRFTTKMNGTSDVNRLLNRYPEKVGRTLESLVKQEARGLAVELARNTRPFGFSEAAKQLGEKAVAKDISGVFALPSDAFEKTKLADPVAADRFWSNIQNRRFSRAEKTLQSSNSQWKDLSVGRLDPALHKWGQLGAAKPKQIVTSPKARDAYIAKIQKRVGFAKGTWINAAKAIGGRVRGSVQWVTRHKQSPGTATVKTGTKPSVTLINSLDYIDQVTTATGIDLALQVAAGRLRKALFTSLQKMAERANRSLRRAS